MSEYYCGMDVHKKNISFCTLSAAGEIVEQGSIEATRSGLDQWLSSQRGNLRVTLEATLFSAWIYDYLLCRVQSVQAAHPLMLKALAASKKKSDSIDAYTIAELSRCRLVVSSYMMPPQLRHLRTILRFRNLMVRQMVQMKNKTAGLLMEYGVPYEKRRLYRRSYQSALLEQLQEFDLSCRLLVGLSQNSIRFLNQMQRRLLRGLSAHALLQQRVQLLQTIPGVGQVMALSWALEVGEIDRLPSVAKAVSYCGLCSRLQESAGKQRRGPISKRRNQHLQHMLVEAAKLAPRFHPLYKALYEKERQKGNRNRATLAVARKLVAYLMAVDRNRRPFVMKGETIH